MRTNNVESHNSRTVDGLTRVRAVCMPEYWKLLQYFDSNQIRINLNKLVPCEERGLSVAGTPKGIQQYSGHFQRKDKREINFEATIIQKEKPKKPPLLDDHWQSKTINSTERSNDTNLSLRGKKCNGSDPKKAKVVRINKSSTDSLWATKRFSVGEIKKNEFASANQTARVWNYHYPTLQENVKFKAARISQTDRSDFRDFVDSRFNPNQSSSKPEFSNFVESYFDKNNKKLPSERSIHSFRKRDAPEGIEANNRSKRAFNSQRPGVNYTIEELLIVPNQPSQETNEQSDHLKEPNLHYRVKEQYDDRKNFEFVSMIADRKKTSTQCVTRAWDDAP